MSPSPPMLTPWLRPWCSKLSRCVAVLGRTSRSTVGKAGRLTVTVFCGGAWRSTHSVHLSTSLVRMPQANKSRTAASSAPHSSAGPVQGPGGNSFPVSVSMGPEETPGGGGHNVGDKDIVKSPSDPKQYRYTHPSVISPQSMFPPPVVLLTTFLTPLPLTIVPRC